MITIHIPTGTPSHLNATIEIENESDWKSYIEWDNTHYQDGHSEGVLWLPNGHSYAVTTEARSD